MKCITKNCIEPADKRSNYCAQCRKDIRQGHSKMRIMNQREILDALDPDLGAFPLLADKYIRIRPWVLVLFHVAGLLAGLCLGRLFL